MKTINRSIAPPLHRIDSVVLPGIEKFELSNGIPVYAIRGGTQEVFKLEIIFDAGRWHESKRSVAATTSKMLLEGTQAKTSQQVSETVDFFGANLIADATIDYGFVTLFGLNKHAQELLPLLHEVITQPSFREKELQTYIQNSRQRLKVNLQKTDFLAHKSFNEKLYGRDHPAGYTTSFEDYDSIDADTLHSFHQTHYHTGGCRIMMAGRITDSIPEQLEKLFGEQFPAQVLNGKSIEHPIQSSPEKKFFVAKDDAVQSAIRIGKFAVNKLHPDFQKLRVLNAVLGGYFGSRLMSNLREEKGYCYGIHSNIASNLHDAFWYVTTEVGKDVTQNAVQEIYSEISRLREERVPEDELNTVKNYLLGTYLSDVDGPFNAAELWRGLIVYGLGEKNFDEMIATVQSVSADELLQLAQKYLDPAAMIEVVVGNEK